MTTTQPPPLPPDNLPDELAELAGATDRLAATGRTLRRHSDDLPMVARLLDAAQRLVGEVDRRLAVCRQLIRLASVPRCAVCGGPYGDPRHSPLSSPHDWHDWTPEG